MKKYVKAEMEIVEIENNDIVTTSGVNESYSTNTNPGSGLPGMPGGHGGTGNVGAECCN